MEIENNQHKLVLFCLFFFYFKLHFTCRMVFKVKYNTFIPWGAEGIHPESPHFHLCPFGCYDGKRLCWCQWNQSPLPGIDEKKEMRRVKL